MNGAVQNELAVTLARFVDWARQQGRKLVDTIHDLLGTDGQLDYEQLATRIGKPLT